MYKPSEQYERLVRVLYRNQPRQDLDSAELVSAINLVSSAKWKRITLDLANEVLLSRTRTGIRPLGLTARNARYELSNE